MPDVYLLKTKIKSWFSRLGLVAQLFAVLILFLLPFMLSGPTHVSASQLTSRKLQISSAIPGGTTVTYTYTFTTVTAAAIQSVKFVACTTATGTYGLGSTASTAGCTAPTSQVINAGSQVGTLGGTWTNTTAFSRDATGASFCTPANNVLCIKRTQAASESAASKSIAWDTQTNPNPASANTSFFIGVYLYSDAGWVTPTDAGTVASSTVQTLTVSATIQEVLNFCVGSTTTDNATSSTGSDCSAIGGSSLNLGTLNSTNVNISPVNTNGGDNKNGVVMLRSNAVNGITVSYDSIQQSGTNHKGSLRVSGANCSAGADSTDQCFDPQGATKGTFSAGTEKFGIAIGYVNCGSTTSYTCTYSSGTYNLTRASNYNCTGSNTSSLTDAGAISGTTQCSYAWVDDGTVTQMASSSGIVDDEALILKFAATPAFTTPTGSYTAQSDFIAVATY